MNLMSNLNAQQLTDTQKTSIYRCYLPAFIAGSFGQLSSDKYLHNWHIDLLASKLEECRLGKIKRLIITIPPRNLKSISVSIAFSAYLLGHNPAEEIIAVSYNQELADKLSSDTSKLINSDFYRHLFPQTRQKRATANLLETHQNGRRYAAGTGGTLTGLGANFIIIDDPIKPADANSETTRQKCNNWFDSTLSTRLNSKKNGCIIIVMQRLHEDDLVGHLLDKNANEWELVNLPAIANEDKIISYNNYLNGKFCNKSSIKCKLGQPLHSQREDAETLQKLRKNMGEYGFSAQYLQQPAPAGGAIIKKDWLCYLPSGKFMQRKQYDRVILSVDAAQAITDLADFSAITIWGQVGEKYYLLHVWRGKVEYAKLKAKTQDLTAQFSPNITLIEDKSSGSALLQDIKNCGNRVIPIRPETDKISRLMAVCSLFEMGQIILPDDKTWLPDYAAELLAFPKSRHDDMVDSTSQALGWMRQNKPSKPRVRSL